MEQELRHGWTRADVCPSGAWPVRRTKRRRRTTTAPAGGGWVGREGGRLREGALSLSPDRDHWCLPACLPAPLSCCSNSPTLGAAAAPLLLPAAGTATPGHQPPPPAATTTGEQRQQRRALLHQLAAGGCCLRLPRSWLAGWLVWARSRRLGRVLRVQWSTWCRWWCMTPSGGPPCSPPCSGPPSAGRPRSSLR